MEGKLSEIQNADLDTLLANLCNKRDKWRIPKGGSLTEDLSATFLKMISVVELGQARECKELQRNIEEYLLEALHLFNSLEQKNVLKKQDMGDDKTHRQRAQDILEIVYHTQWALMHTVQAKNIMLGANSSDKVDEAILNRLGFAPKDEEKTSPFQNLVTYLLRTAYDRGYRKYQGNVYEAIRTGPNDVYSTHAWQMVSTMSEYVYKHTDKDLNYHQWKNLTHARGNPEAAEKHLTLCQDRQFPELVFDRHVFAFRNGVYNAKDNWDKNRCCWVDKFYPFEDSCVIPNNLVACKFFDMDFDNYDHIKDWYDIPTPHLQSVMSYQEFPEEVCRWAYVFFGRLMYDVGEIDGWQVIPFFKGMASSGKSTLVKMCKNFYQGEDVGVLSNNVEKQFGLSAFFDKLMFIAPEIKNDLRIEQAEFQSMISGEDVQVAIKNKKAHSVVWKVPGVLAGNEVPAWADNSGSIQRRIILFEFVRQVEKGDMQLDKKLELELPAIIKKCVSAYLSTARTHAKENVWTILPDYFKKTREDLAEATNALENFLASGMLKFDPNIYIKYQNFSATLNQHCIENNFRRPTFNKDFWAGPFHKYKLKITNGKHKYPRQDGEYTSGRWIVGCDIAEEVEEGLLLKEPGDNM